MERSSRWGQRFALGTVQFGLDYGISNRTGRVSESAAVSIVEHAFSRGVDTLDTAVGYGCSENVLGRLLAGSQHHPRIVSKFPKGTSAETLGATLQGSLSRLGQRALHAYLAHDSASLADPKLVA